MVDDGINSPPPPVDVVVGGGAGACFLGFNLGLVPTDGVEMVLI